LAEKLAPEPRDFAEIVDSEMPVRRLEVRKGTTKVAKGTAGNASQLGSQPGFRTSTQLTIHVGGESQYAKRNDGIEDEHFEGECPFMSDATGCKDKM
jgi:hypothetical protein